MKNYFKFILVFFVINVQAQKNTNQKVIEDGGQGQYKAIVKGETGLPEHSVFRPLDMKKAAKKGKLPIMIWGNGGCANSSTLYQNFLNEIASHGYVIFANGPFVAEGDSLSKSQEMKQTTSPMLVQSLDWIWRESKNPNSEYYGKVDLTKVAVAGMSCGGLQSIEVASDSRITTTLVLNSGVMNTPPPKGMGLPMVTKAALGKIHTPTLYVLGDTSDIAYNNGMDDYAKINHVPIVVANLPVGHGGTYHEAHGGAFAPLILDWLNWQLKNKKKLSTQFTGKYCGYCGKNGWRLESKNFK